MIITLIERVKKISKDGKITCGKALKLAAEKNFSTRNVGKAANELKLKITSCSLGCFK
ncbi:MAG TPA: hypothetical protein PL110_20680 [Candidatus Eremiobacteraeota bacterium]|nr:MAG: hypothetical protein BWY64_02110 [bacterium ADurb.Bin363]HPZ10517.1 hypothetical protein [Candidatus Eremiobacteraeota bacterium]